MENVIEMLNITKKFPGIIANDNVTFLVRKGEIHALLGENGAGKSTLMSVLFGLYQPEKGSIRINGQEAKIRNPNDANRYHIGMVHQHFKLVQNFTVLENIILGVESTRRGFLEMNEARDKVIKLSEKYKLKIDPDALVSDITVGMQQRVEILKMLYRENEILIFDEPTAVLTPQEIIELIKIMKDLVHEGKSIVFITHKLNEIKEAADRCSVLRKGKYIGTVDVRTTSKEQMSEMMVGRQVNFAVDKKAAIRGEQILKVEHLSVKTGHHGQSDVDDISFAANRGEIVCIAGIDGNGQSELVYALTGLLPAVSGRIEFMGRDITHLSIRDRTRLGMAHIPEDRHKYGLVLDYSLEENLVLQRYFERPFSVHGFLQFDAIEQFAQQLIERFDIRSGQGSKTSARSMSGGNQQKAILAREIERDPELLIAVQPTRGLDVGAIEYIHGQIIAQRDQGKAILLISLELDEVMDVSDRILVMHNGRIVADMLPEEVTMQELGLYMSGAKVGAGYER
ncbi:MAG: ABC transporter ATP-binding protein [Negativicutes bacterium]|nr:ABC transporter ATP-binding protein [Negativicutes bacterium]